MIRGYVIGNSGWRWFTRCLSDRKLPVRGCKAISTREARASIFVWVAMLAVLMVACSSDRGAAVSQCWNDDEARYFETLRQVKLRFFESSQDMELLVAAFIEDPTLFSNDAWRIDATFALAGYSSMAAEIRALNPPRSVRSIHHGQLVMAQELEGFSVMYASWMDTLHTDTLKEALKYLERANDIIEETDDDIERFCQ